MSSTAVRVVSFAGLAREAAAEWVSQASVEDLFARLPSQAFEKSIRVARSLEKSAKPVHKPMQAKAISPNGHSNGHSNGHHSKLEVVVHGEKVKPATRIPKRLGNMTNEIKAEIKKQIGSLQVNSPEYLKVRDTLCKEFRLKRRQVSSVIRMARVSPEAMALQVKKMTKGKRALNGHAKK